MGVIRFNNLQLLHNPLLQSFVEDLSQSIEDSDFVLGSSVRQFEEAFATYTNSRYCVAVANGSDALRLALRTAGVKQGDRVALAANTYFAAAAAVLHLGATPVFYDVNPETRFPDTENFESIARFEPSAVIRSHLFGFPDSAPLPSILKDIIDVHDCSQAHGTRIRGTHVGGSSLSTYSFYPGKNLGALGDAGAITAVTEDQALELKMLRNQGSGLSRYDHLVDGYNSRLDTLQARFLLRKLIELEQWNSQRRFLANLYDEGLGDVKGQVKIFSANKDITSSYHLYQIQVHGIPNVEVGRFLTERGIEWGMHYPIPLNEQKALEGRYLAAADLGVSKQLSETLISLPMHPNLEPKDVKFVVSAIKEFVRLYASK
jgi:dTDP-4-amino-4,6-dideoxygalactose transaminase